LILPTLSLQAAAQVHLLILLAVAVLACLRLFRRSCLHLCLHLSLSWLNLALDYQVRLFGGYLFPYDD